MLYAMMRYGARLERRQMTLFRFVDIGAELFAMSAACVRAQMLVRRGRSGHEAVQLADHFCRLSRRRVVALFRTIFHNEDAETYRVSQQVMNSEHLWMEAGIVGLERALESGHEDRKESLVIA